MFRGRALEVAWELNGNKSGTRSAQTLTRHCRVRVEDSVCETMAGVLFRSLLLFDNAVCRETSSSSSLTCSMTLGLFWGDQWSRRPNVPHLYHEVMVPVKNIGCLSIAGLLAFVATAGRESEESCRIGRACDSLEGD